MATTSKSERLLNLLIMLLVQKRFVSKQHIREILYPDSSVDAFEKMFERDKEELRSLGVPIEVGHLDAFFEDEPGYRVRSETMSLPEVTLTADEAAVIGLATKVWQHARLASATTDAVRKLKANGAELDLDALSIIEPRLSADEPSFDAFLEATQERRPVRFTYRRPDQDEPTLRHVQPWGVTRSSGRWYVVGFDTDRGEQRVFRLSRVEGEPLPDGPPGAYEVPSDVDLGEVTRRLAPTGHRDPLVVLAREGAALSLRRTADVQERGVVGPDGSPGWDRLVLPHATSRSLDEVLSFGADVLVEGPESLRARIIERLDAAAADA